MKSPAFQFYVNDFLGSAKVGMMSTEEVGAYLLLLCLDWQEGGFLYDPKRLAKWCRLSPAAFRRAWEQVGQCFTEIDGRYRNSRLDAERTKQAEWRAKSRKGGVASGEARAKGGSLVVEPEAKGGSSVAEPSTQPKGNTPSSTPSPSSTPVTTSSSSAGDVTRLLDGLPTDAVRLSWRAEIEAVRQGMHGPPLTDEQIGRACRDYVGNGHLASPSLRHFRAFLADAGRPAKAPRGAPTGESPFLTPEMRQWAVEDDARREREKAGHG